MTEENIIRKEVFADLPLNLNPEEPFFYIYDDFLKADFAEELRLELLETWPEKLVSREKVQYRGELVNYWHYAQRDLKMLAELQETLKISLQQRNLQPADISAYALEGNCQQGFHIDRGYANLIIHLSKPEKNFGGETIMYACALDEVVYADEARDNWTLLNAWARIAPVKFNRAILLNGNFTHGVGHLNTPGNDLGSLRLSLTAFHKFS